MRGLPFAAMVLASVPASALACTVIEQERASVRRGDDCQVSYVDIKAPYSVSSSQATDLGGGIVRQSVHNGICDAGERIVTYFDCASRTGAWLGGPINAADLPQPAPDANGYAAPFVGEGIDGAFVRVEEPKLAGGPRPEAVLARVRQLGWVKQSGRIESPRLVVDGKRFDLNCGCKLYYPNGVPARKN